ncbi:MAG TPA: energy transducer TonB [Thioalkalivibrio sp.]|nr:energy transducer TonB [Thioalkalivibrio sp.]
MQSYAANLQAWLERHKHYPRRARLRREEGVTLLYFVVNRNGEVLDYRIEQSSGHLSLDEEVLAMIRRAQPLLPFPDFLPRESMELVVPVQFSLR